MEPFVEQFCTQMTRSRLASADEVKAWQQRWREEAGDRTANPRDFRRWLVKQGHLTKYQAKLLSAGHTEGFFLNQYKILDRIGRGRMAGVFKAVHPSGQVVAIKVLPPSKARDPQVMGRFLREAQLGQRLHHPNIVRTFQMGQAHGVHYLVMEYLEGETLQAVLRRRRNLPASAAGRLVYQALLGLQHMHEQGLVHRDLEPGNLMLLPVPGKKRTVKHAHVKILDIGLARALVDEAPLDGVRVVSSEGDLLGTAPYMAPEQARDLHSADIRADIYSLGCILYHALTGQPPFPDANVLNQIVRHATEAPRPLREFGVEVPAGLQEVLDKMLAKDPAQRYATPKQAAESLGKTLVGKRATAKPAPAPPQLQAFLKWLESDSQEDLALRNPAPAESAGAPPAPSRPYHAPSPSPPAQQSHEPPPPGGVGELVPRTRRDVLMLALGAVLLLVLAVTGGFLWLLLESVRR
jgi:serine/threonine protein kinase